MTKFSDPIEYEVCANCLIALANDDYSGMDDAEERQTREGLHYLHCQHDRVIPDGEDLGFSHEDCECCDALAGERFKVICLDEISG